MNAPAASLGRQVAPKLENWRAVVWPLFWPVFFWNLRIFLRLIQERKAAVGPKGVFIYEVTWYGVIKIHWMQPPTPARWDDDLGGCARRVGRVLRRDAGDRAFNVEALVAQAKAVMAGLLANPRAATGRRARLASGASPGPARLDTS
ncbi:MAG: hypothetical protein AAF753_08440 [Pseudomonadota bacterium]